MEGLKKGTIVITGGAGFIGGNLVKQLIKSGNQSIVVIDNQINKDSIYATEDLNLKTTLRIADIRKKELIEEIFISEE